MSLRNIVFGRPLASSEEAREELSVVTGVTVLGLDALASTGYDPEAALTVLLPLGTLGLRYLLLIIMIVIVQPQMLYLSYQQTAATYPNGSGAHIVAHDYQTTLSQLIIAVAGQGVFSAFLFSQFGMMVHWLRRLRTFKEKFHPAWSPRYLVCLGLISLPFVVMVIVRADSRGSIITAIIGGR